MDIYKSTRERDNDYFYSLGQLAVSDLMKVAYIVSSRHIKDFFVRARFEGDVKAFANANLNLIKNSKSDNVCKEAIGNCSGSQSKMVGLAISANLSSD